MDLGTQFPIRLFMMGQGTPSASPSVSLSPFERFVFLLAGVFDAGGVSSRRHHFYCPRSKCKDPAFFTQISFAVAIAGLCTLRVYSFVFLMLLSSLFTDFILFVLSATVKRAVTTPWPEYHIVPNFSPLSKLLHYFKIQRHLESKAAKLTDRT